MTLVFYLNTGKINSNDLLVSQIRQIGPILNYLLSWAYLLAALAVVFAIGFPAFQMVTNPKSGLKALISIGIIGLLMFIAYQLGDGTVMNIAGYNGPDNIPTRLKMSDMILFSMYGMIVISTLAVLYAEISKLFK
ncbi:MAG: hypothetical protein WC865_09475 [Bacteroidales bacterium]